MRPLGASTGALDYLLLYRDLGAIRWHNSGEKWQRSRKENQWLRAPFSKAYEMWVGECRQQSLFAPVPARMRESGNTEADRKPGSVEDNHSSGTVVTDCLKQPTREPARDRRCGRKAAYSPIWSCSGRGLPCRDLLPVTRCALTAPFHPYRHQAGGLFSVALSMGSRPPGITWRPVRRSPDFPPPPRGVTAIAWPAPVFPGRDSTAICLGPYLGCF